jgi:hypothetical protein
MTVSGENLPIRICVGSGGVRTTMWRVTAGPTCLTGFVACLPAVTVAVKSPIRRNLIR